MSQVFSNGFHVVNECKIQRKREAVFSFGGYTGTLSFYYYFYFYVTNVTYWSHCLNDLLRVAKSKRITPVEGRKQALQFTSKECGRVWACSLTLGLPFLGMDS